MPLMLAHLVPRKTIAAHQLLQGARQALAPGLRMLLITVDGRKPFAELLVLARGLGFSAEAFERLRDEGLIAWSEPAREAEEADRARRLVRAKVFAMDLAARMLAGQDHALRERARRVVTETGFHAWLDECASAIGQLGGDERAALFRERVGELG